MGKKKKKQFIDKKSAHKFTLVHRSQRDPLQADDEVGEHVLLPVDQTNDSGEKNQTEDNVKYGITYDDDYDYMQHLRPRGEGMLILADTPSKPSEIIVKDEEDREDVSFGNLKLPSDAFASAQEEDIGMLNKGVLPRGPQPDWDPDIVQALDEDVDFDDPDNFLDDDFIMKANADGGLIKDGCDLSEGLFSERRSGYQETGNEDDEWETDSENGSYFSSDNLMSDDEDPFANEETKSRFTNYSMTSSVIRRTEGLKVLDDRFERIMEEYDEEAIGCVDQEEVQGVFNVNNDLVNNVIDDFYESNKKHDLSKTKDGDDDENLIEDNDAESEEEDEEKIFEQFMTKPKEKWDCESIISTHSNIYNHPKLIAEESTKKYQLHKRTGIPIGVFAESAKKDEDDDADEEDVDTEMMETVELNNVRNKDETPEQRKQRKKDVKEQRKNRRIEKKSNKIAFKSEQKKQEKIVSNTIAQRGNFKL